MSVLKAKREAREVLEEVGVTSAPVDVYSVAESLGVRCREAELGDDVSGLLMMKDGEAVIGYNRSHSKTRQRFTVAHEIAHYRLHHSPGEIFIDKGVLTWFRNGKSATGDNPEERDANAFAAELLMPEKLVKAEIAQRNLRLTDDKDIEILASVFDVSIQAMMFRLLNLRIISSALHS